MNVQIVVFPETKVAAVEHRGSPQLEYETAKKLVAWRQRHQLERNRHRSYGVHYTDPHTTAGPDVKEHDMITDVYLPLKG